MLRYYSELIDEGDQDSEIALITLWTKKDVVKQKVNGFRYIGQLYSKPGIDVLFRNCLYDKNIRHIILFGADLSKSGKNLVEIFQGKPHDIENIPPPKIKEVISNVKLHDLRNSKINELQDFIDSINISKGSYGEPEEFPEPKINAPLLYPSDKTGFIIKEDYICDAWLKILNQVMRFGVQKPSSYKESQKELLNLMCVISQEDADSPNMASYFRFAVDELENYFPQVLSKNKLDNIEYTYGLRLMDHDHIDQIDIITKKLKEEPYSRRAIGVTWNVSFDSNKESSPCLILVQAIIENKRLFLTAYFRSNDMFEAWPKNAFALRKLQKRIADDLKCNMGSLTTISCSAHIYERNFEDAKKIISENQVKEKLHDPRGNLIIYLKDKKIHVCHQSNEEKILEEFYADSARSMIDILIKKSVISDVSHAYYIGGELEKAQIALMNDLEYVQDQPIRIRIP